MTSTVTDGGDRAREHPAVRRVVDRMLGIEPVEALRSGISGSDLTSLLLDVMRSRAEDRSVADLVRQYERDRFVRPAQVDARALLTMRIAALDAVGPEFEPVETAPLVPLGTHSVMTGVSQHRVVATVRSTEVAADPTTSLALEAATRRRQSRSGGVVRLAAIERVVRAQRFEGPRSFAHFTLLGLVSAGRDTGDRAFEQGELVHHVRALHAVCEAIGFPTIQVRVTGLGSDGTADVDVAAAAMSEPGVTVTPWPERPAGRSYYDTVCFTVSVEAGDEVVEVADGGDVDWTRSLLADRKERMMISGLSLERLAQLDAEREL